MFVYNFRRHLIKLNKGVIIFSLPIVNKWKKKSLESGIKSSAYEKIDVRIWT